MKNFYLIFLLTFLSCENKKLNEKKIHVNDIEINRYQISLISSIHDHLEVSKGNETEQILKVNTNDIDTIYVKNDTIIIKTFENPVIYELKEKAFNYFIQIDSTAKQ